MKAIVTVIIIGIGLCACSAKPGDQIVAIQGPPLPHAMSNNAVAGYRGADGYHLFSFMGLSGGRSWQDITSEAWHLPPDSETWQRLADVPGDKGRLAGTAATVAGQVYVFGGYTVAADGGEKSVDSVYRLDTENFSWQEVQPIPVPVDDAVSVVYLDRYVYLVSGWHDTANVNLVQVYDALENSWSNATPWPGEAVFGHAGAITGNRVLVCDGAAVREGVHGKRRFELVQDCFLGEISARDIQVIHWQKIDPHPWHARYRMAAAGTQKNGGEIVFAGGTDNPYNYDGTGYNGIVSRASADVFAWRMAEQRWVVHGRLPTATMDHRGLLANAGSFFIVGGMTNANDARNGEEPVPGSQVIEFSLR